MLFETFVKWESLVSVLFNYFVVLELRECIFLLLCHCPTGGAIKR